MRDRRLGVRVSETKLSDQRWFGPSGITIGALALRARLRPPRRGTRSPPRVDPQQLLGNGRQALPHQQMTWAALAEPVTLGRAAATDHRPVAAIDTGSLSG